MQEGSQTPHPSECSKCAHSARKKSIGLGQPPGLRRYIGQGWISKDMPLEFLFSSWDFANKSVSLSWGNASMMCT